MIACNVLTASRTQKISCNQMPANSTHNFHVLIVDDDRDLCRMLVEYLAAERFQVETEHDGQAGVERIRSRSFDAVVLDITMPVLDGFEALRQIRRFSNVPVLMLTARGDELDRIVGLEIGADDYLPKPFNPRELAARLKAILRRVGAREVADPRVVVEDMVLEPGSRSLKVNGRNVDLTSTEFGILEALARSAGEVVAKVDLSRSVLGRRLTPYDRSLDTHIANLRRKLGPDSDGRQRIKTIRSQGYLLAVS